MITDLFSSLANALAASPLTPAVAVAVMLWRGAETYGRVRAARRVAREAEDFAAYLVRDAAARTADVAHEPDVPQVMTGGFARTVVVRRGACYLAETLVPLRQRLQADEIIAPLYGLGFSMLSWTLALPGAIDVLRSDPDQVLRTLAMGSATSFIGVAIAIVAHMAGNRLDIVQGRIASLLDDLDGDPPAPRPDRDAAPRRGAVVA